MKTIELALVTRVILAAVALTISAPGAVGSLSRERIDFIDSETPRD
jgi:hypothetical protein